MTERDDYTWDLACKDIALMTNLTFNEACDITWELKALNIIHPYDAVPTIKKLTTYLRLPMDRQKIRGFGRALGSLIFAAKLMEKDE